MKRVLIGIFGLGVFVGALWLGWAFRSENALPVDLDLIWFQVAQVELWWLALLAMGAGAALMFVIIGFAWLRLRLLLGRSRSRVRRLEKEVHELRSLPLVGSGPESMALPQEPARLKRSSLPAAADRS